MIPIKKSDWKYYGTDGKMECRISTHSIFWIDWWIAICEEIQIDVRAYRNNRLAGCSPMFSGCLWKFKWHDKEPII